MKAALKAALALAALAAALLALRAMGRGEAGRWRERLEPYCKGAVVGVDEKGLIVIAGDREQALLAAAEVRDFRRVLAARYGDLLGVPRFERMVVGIFPDVERLQAYAGASMRADRGAAGLLQGYTDPVRGAVFVPADAVGTLRHETVHWVMETARNPAAPAYSPWLSEGLAQLFETLDPLADPPEPPRVFASPGGDVDVDRLVHMEEYGRFVAEDGLRNYRDALLLCAFLLEKRPADLREYVEQERTSAVGRPLLFRERFAYDREPFRSEFAAFIGRVSR